MTSVLDELRNLFDRANQFRHEPLLSHTENENEVELGQFRRTNSNTLITRNSRQTYASDATPENFADLNDDVTLYIFSFLDLKSVLACRWTCSNWMKISESDVLWKEMYDYEIYRQERQFHTRFNVDRSFRDRRVTKNYFDAFLQLKTTVKEEQQKTEYYKQALSRMQKFAPRYQRVYSTLGPALVWLGILLSSILLPLYLQGSMDATTVNLWIAISPLVFLTLPGYVFAAASCIIDPLFVSGSVLRYKAILNHSTAHVDVQATEIINIVVLGLHCVPMMSISIFFKFIVFPEAAWRVAFMPTWILFLGYVLGVPLYIYVRDVKRAQFQKQLLDSKLTVRQREQMSRLSNPPTIAAKAIGSFFGTANTIAFAQFALIAAKLDNAIGASWSVTLIPVWIIISGLVLTICISPVVAVLFERNVAALACGVALAVQFHTLFLQISLALVIARADLFLVSENFTYVQALVPFYIWCSANLLAALTTALRFKGYSWGRTPSIYEDQYALLNQDNQDHQNRPLLADDERDNEV